ncbi:MAG TPA: DUF882 domain-containing protein [Caulobacteraceae bacterium]|nr:DUF882 domain-containing protein [Caulobacteraceae bacterium]
MTLPRRAFLGAATAAFGLGSLAASNGLAMPTSGVRKLGFDNLHTGETLEVAYWENGTYVPGALAEVNHVLRDFRTGDVHPIEPGLLDLLVLLQGRVEKAERFQVISGYRSPLTNAVLHERSHQVASGSLHMQGKAIDIRLPGVELTHLRDAALSLAVGGVGYYPTSDFVHVDVGRVRRWAGS